MKRHNITNLLQEKRYQEVYVAITNDPDALHEMMDIFLNGHYRIMQKLTHVQDIIIKNKSTILEPYYKEMIAGLLEDRPDTYLRNTYRYFQDARIPEDYDGLLYDIAFKHFTDPKSAIAIRAFAMKTCVNIALPYPELWPELIDAISLCQRDESPGIKSRSRQMLKLLNKLN